MTYYASGPYFTGQRVYDIFIKYKLQHRIYINVYDNSGACTPSPSNLRNFYVQHIAFAIPSHNILPRATNIPTYCGRILILFYHGDKVIILSSV